jgi:GTP-binding protein EngB required for normal cell division
MDWSSFTKGYFLNRDTLVGVLLLVDASVPPQKIDLDCANWLGRNNVSQLALHLIMSPNAGCGFKYQVTYLQD